MKKNNVVEVSDFKETIDRVSSELLKRKLTSKFYKRFEFTPSLVSQWKSGKRIASNEQQTSFIKLTVELISEHDNAKKNQEDERSILLAQFSTLIGA